MKAKIIKIGNSKGLRLSKTILEKYEIEDTVELVMKKDFIELRSVKNPREGWDLEFEKMSTNGDDQLIIDDIFEDEALDEWK